MQTNGMRLRDLSYVDIAEALHQRPLTTPLQNVAISGPMQATSANQFKSKKEKRESIERARNLLHVEWGGWQIILAVCHGACTVQETHGCQLEGGCTSVPLPKTNS